MADSTEQLANPPSGPNATQGLNVTWVPNPLAEMAREVRLAEEFARTMEERRPTPAPRPLQIDLGAFWVRGNLAEAYAEPTAAETAFHDLVTREGVAAAAAAVRRDPRILGELHSRPDAADIAASGAKAEARRLAIDAELRARRHQHPVQLDAAGLRNDRVRRTMLGYVHGVIADQRRFGTTNVTRHRAFAFDLERPSHTAGLVSLPYTSPSAAIPGSTRLAEVFDPTVKVVELTAPLTLADMARLRDEPAQFGRVSLRSYADLRSREFRQPTRFHVCVSCGYGKHDRRPGREAAYDICRSCHSTHGLLPTELYKQLKADLGRRGLIEAPARGYNYDSRFPQIAEYLQEMWRARHLVFGVASGQQFTVYPYSDLATRRTISAGQNGHPYSRPAAQVGLLERLHAIRGTYPTLNQLITDLSSGLGRTQRSEDELMTQGERSWRTNESIWERTEEREGHSGAARITDFTDQRPVVVEKGAGLSNAEVARLSDAIDAERGERSQGAGESLREVGTGGHTAFRRGRGANFTLYPYSDITTQRTLSAASDGTPLIRPAGKIPADEHLMPVSGRLPALDKLVRDFANAPDPARLRRGHADPHFHIGALDEILPAQAMRSLPTPDVRLAARADLVERDWAEALRDDRAWHARRDRTKQRQILNVNRDESLTRRQKKREIAKIERRWSPRHLRAAPLASPTAPTLVPYPERAYATGVDEALQPGKQNRFLREHNARVAEWLREQKLDPAQFNRDYPLNVAEERADITPRDENDKPIPIHERLTQRDAVRAAEATNWAVHGGALSPEAAAEVLAEFRSATTPVETPEFAPVAGYRAADLQVEFSVPVDPERVRAELATLQHLDPASAEWNIGRLTEAAVRGPTALSDRVASLVWDRGDQLDADPGPPARGGWWPSANGIPNFAPDEITRLQASEAGLRAILGLPAPRLDEARLAAVVASLTDFDPGERATVAADLRAAVAAGPGALQAVRRDLEEEVIRRSGYGTSFDIESLNRIARPGEAAAVEHKVTPRATEPALDSRAERPFEIDVEAARAELAEWPLVGRTAEAGLAELIDAAAHSRRELDRAVADLVWARPDRDYGPAHYEKRDDPAYQLEEYTPLHTEEERGLLETLERNLRAALGLPEPQIDLVRLVDEVTSIPGLTAAERATLTEQITRAAQAGPGALDDRIAELAAALAERTTSGERIGLGGIVIVDGELATDPPQRIHLDTPRLLAIASYGSEPDGLRVTLGSEAMGLQAPVPSRIDTESVRDQVDQWVWLAEGDRHDAANAVILAATRGRGALSDAIAEHVWSGSAPDNVTERREAEFALRKECGLGGVHVDGDRLARVIDTLPNWGHLDTRARHAIHFGLMNAARIGPGALNNAFDRAIEAGITSQWGGADTWGRSALAALQATVGDLNTLRQELGQTPPEIREISFVRGAAFITPAFVRTAGRPGPDAAALWPEGRLIEAHERVRQSAASLNAERKVLIRSAGELDRLRTQVVSTGREFLGQLRTVVADPVAFQKHFKGLSAAEKRGILDVMEANPAGLEQRIGEVGRLAGSHVPTVQTLAGEKGLSKLLERAVAGGDHYQAVISAPSVARIGHAYLAIRDRYRDKLSVAAAALEKPVEVPPRQIPAIVLRPVELAGHVVLQRAVESREVDAARAARGSASTEPDVASAAGAGPSAHPGAVAESTIKTALAQRIESVEAALAALETSKAGLGTEPDHGAAFNRLSQFNAAEQHAVMERFPNAGKAMKMVGESRLQVVFDRRRSQRETLMEHNGNHRSPKQKAIVRDRMSRAGVEM